MKAIITQSFLFTQVNIHWDITGLVTMRTERPGHQASSHQSSARRSGGITFLRSVFLYLFVSWGWRKLMQPYSQPSLL